MFWYGAKGNLALAELLLGEFVMSNDTSDRLESKTGWRDQLEKTKENDCWERICLRGNMKEQKEGPSGGEVLIFIVKWFLLSANGKFPRASLKDCISTMPLCRVAFFGLVAIVGTSLRLILAASGFIDGD